MSLAKVMVTPVARSMSGAVLPVQLTEEEESGAAVWAGEGRGRIAMALQVPRNRIRLVHPASRLLYDDGERLGAEVQVILLAVDPEAEAAAEAALRWRTRAKPTNRMTSQECL